MDQMLPELEKSDISSLRLENAELTERHIEIVSGMKSLKVLHFSNVDFPDSGLGRLKELKQLESLIIEPSLNPDRNTEDFLTDRDLDFLMDLRNLKQVRLVSKGGVTRFELATSTSRSHPIGCKTCKKHENSSVFFSLQISQNSAIRLIFGSNSAITLQ
ncbi:MAG: hypothetical protein KDA87_14540 [Planctomycetales bacterium]|nr:hypothetical protein [Planctomycetales bacterium]